MMDDEHPAPGTTGPDEFPASDTASDSDIIEGLADDLAADAPAGATPRKPRDNRRAFGAAAVILALILLALVAYLLFWRNDRATALEPPPPGVEVVLTIDGPMIGEEPLFDSPMAATFARDGSIYVADSKNNRICVFDSDGRFLFEFGGLGVRKPLPGIKATWKPGLLDYPLGMDVDDAGNLYVADFYNNQIQVFTARGEPIRVFPDPTKRTGKGSSGIGGKGIAVTDVDVRGRTVYATDTYQIFSFDTSGALLGQFSKPGTGSADLSHPNGIATAPDGTIYVADTNHSRVLAFTPEGKLKWATGRPRRGVQDTQISVFELPRGIAVTDAGSLLIADTFGFNITVLTPGGDLVRTYSARGVQPGAVNFPNGVDVRDDLILVADRGNNRVQVLRFIGLR